MLSFYIRSPAINSLMKRITGILCIIVFCGGIALALGVANLSFNASGRVNAGFGRGTDSIEKTALCADGSLIALGRAAPA